MTGDFFNQYWRDIWSALTPVDNRELQDVAERIINCSNRGGKVIIVGNGGSAAMASHVAVDLTKAAGVRSINFNEADLITCFANDYGYESWTKKALEAYADPDDVVVLISSSGKSPNIINGAQFACESGLELVTLSGFAADNPLRDLGAINLWVDSAQYNYVELTHQIWLLAIVDYIIDIRGL